MQKVTLRVPEKQVKMLDALVDLGDFPSVTRQQAIGVLEVARTSIAPDAHPA